MIDELFAHTVFPARVVCETCQISAPVVDADQGRRWLRGHGEVFHDGPFEVGVWTNVEALRYGPEVIAEATQDLLW